MPDLAQRSDFGCQTDSPCRISRFCTIAGRQYLMREARVADATAIKALFDFVYGGRYPDTDLDHLAEDLFDQSHNLCVVTEFDERIVGCVMIKMAPEHRLGKGGRALVLPEFRKSGLAPTMLKLAIDYLCVETGTLDVVYGTSRTISAGPAKMSAGAGMVQMGLFPNAVQIDNMEHLNLEVYLSPAALNKRRPRPTILPAFQRIFDLAMSQLGCDESAALASLNPPPVSHCNIALTMNNDQHEVARRYHLYLEQDRLSHAFYPFHFPTAILASEDGSTEVFIWYEGRGKRSAIVGYRSDRTEISELLRAVASTLEHHGASYLELLVPAHNPIAQQSAYAARFLPCAYFPAMLLGRDGMREDYFVLSRTFRLLDFTEVTISPQNARFLRAYMAGYYQLYIEPLLGPLPAEIMQ